MYASCQGQVLCVCYRPIYFGQCHSATVWYDGRLIDATGIGHTAVGSQYRSNLFSTRYLPCLPSFFYLYREKKGPAIIPFIAWSIIYSHFFSCILNELIAFHPLTLTLTRGTQIRNCTEVPTWARACHESFRELFELNTHGIEHQARRQNPASLLAFRQYHIISYHVIW